MRCQDLSIGRKEELNLDVELKRTMGPRMGWLLMRVVSEL
jgi:hypothetical protein